MSFLAQHQRRPSQEVPPKPSPSSSLRLNATRSYPSYRYRGLIHQSAITLEEHRRCSPDSTYELARNRLVYQHVDPSRRLTMGPKLDKIFQVMQDEEHSSLDARGQCLSTGPV